MISFDVRSSLESSREEGLSVALDGCNIRPGKYDPALEIMASTHTRVESSPKCFKIDLISLCEEGSRVVDIALSEYFGGQSMCECCG